MRTIKDCIVDLKTKRDWSSIEEINKVFDEILEIDTTKTNNIIEAITKKATIYDGVPTVIISLEQLKTIIRETK